MNWVMFLFFLILIALMIFGLYDLGQKKKSASDVSRRIDKFGPFKDVERLIKHPYLQNKTCFLAIGRDKSILIGDDYRETLLKPSQLVGVEIISDNKTITKTSRTGRVVGATVGYALAGPLGGAVGSLSGSKTTHEQPTFVTLRLLIDDPSIDIFDIDMKESTSIGVTSPESMMQQARHWQSKLSIIASRNRR